MKRLLALALACGPAQGPVTNHGTSEPTAYAGLFVTGAHWELPCEVRGYMSRRGVVRRATLHCSVVETSTVGNAQLAHVTCEDGDWVDAQLTGWYLADERGLWKLDNETSPQDIPIAPDGNIDEPRRIAAGDVGKLAVDHMLLAAHPQPRTVDDRTIGEGMRIIIDTQVGAAWCVQQVSSYGGAPRWRTFCYQAGGGLVGASQANGEAGIEQRCGVAPPAEFPRPPR